MKALLVAIGYLVCAACGSPTSSPPQGTVYFRMSELSCDYHGSKDVTFFINGVEAGTESIAAGVSSLAYLTQASAAYAFPERNPVVSARVANYTATGGALWTLRTNIKVIENQSMTHSFDC